MTIGACGSPRLVWSLPDRNKTLAPDYDIGWDFFDVMVKDHIMQYNYTLNPEGIFNAIKYMYTYYPDPNNRSHIREEFINVRRSTAKPKESTD